MIVFENNGLIDINAVKLLGVSVKSDSAIGYFGTGLKFAISTILRHNLRIELFIGKQKILFFTKPISVRDKAFDQIMLQVEDEPAIELGFTTEMGKDWQLWMAYRELYCNAIDEGGTVYSSEKLILRSSNTTRFFVYGAEFEIVHNSRDNFILSSEPIFEHPSVDIHPGPSNAIFYRGIKVADIEKPSAFTYNIKDKLSLTEDRTLKYEWDARSKAALALVKCDKREILEKALFTGKGFFENTLSFNVFNDSHTFREVVSEAALRFDTRLNPNARLSMKDFLDTALMNAGISNLTALQQRQLERAVTMLKKLNLITDQYPIIVSDFLGENILGRAHDSKIYIAKRVFELGTKQVASAIFEEFVHLETQFLDETRELQTYLFDRVLSLGEEILSEPF